MKEIKRTTEIATRLHNQWLRLWPKDKRGALSMAYSYLKTSKEISDFKKHLLSL